MSNAKITTTATGKNSATIASIQVSCAGKTGTGANLTLDAVESNIFTISVTDSRGFVTTTTVTKTLVMYVKCAITSIGLERLSTTSNTIKMNAIGQFFNASFGSSSNTLTLKFRYKQKGGSWSSYATLTATKSGNKFTYSGNLGTNFNFQQEYEFEIVASDLLVASTRNITVTRGIPIIDIGENDVNINGDFLINEQSIFALLNNKENIKAKFDGSIGADNTEEGLVLTNIDTPDGLYYYIRTMFYLEGIKSQIAHGYNTSKVYYRYKYPATAAWTDWVQIGPPQSKWKNVNWSGNATGGTISVDANLIGKFVDLQFVSSSNSAHRTHISFFWNTTNNYLLTQMSNSLIYVVCNSTTSTSFNLSISPTNIKLEDIRYLE